MQDDMDALFKSSAFHALRYRNIQMKFFRELPDCYSYQMIHSLFELSVGLVWTIYRQREKTLAPPTDSDASVSHSPGSCFYLLGSKEARVLASIEQPQNWGDGVSSKEFKDFAQNSCRRRIDRDRPFGWHWW
jgi:hypothetical protein